MNLYVAQTGAFAEAHKRLATPLATHTAVVLRAAQEHERAEHLEAALDSNRRIGIAIGILMSQHKLTDQQAFTMLKDASQHTNIKLGDLAEEVALAGTLTVPPRPAEHN